MLCCLLVHPGCFLSKTACLRRLLSKQYSAASVSIPSRFRVRDPRCCLTPLSLSVNPPCYTSTLRFWLRLLTLGAGLPCRHTVSYHKKNCARSMWQIARCCKRRSALRPLPYDFRTHYPPSLNQDQCTHVSSSSFRLRTSSPLSELFSLSLTTLAAAKH